MPYIVRSIAMFRLFTVHLVNNRTDIRQLFHACRITNSLRTRASITLLCSTFTAAMLLFAVYLERPSCMDDRSVVGVMHTPNGHLLNAVCEFYTHKRRVRCTLLQFVLFGSYDFVIIIDRSLFKSDVDHTIIFNST